MVASCGRRQSIRLGAFPQNESYSWPAWDPHSVDASPQAITGEVEGLVA